MGFLEKIPCSCQDAKSANCQTGFQHHFHIQDSAEKDRGALPAPGDQSPSAGLTQSPCGAGAAAERLSYSLPACTKAGRLTSAYISLLSSFMNMMLRLRLEAQSSAEAYLATSHSAYLVCALVYQHAT